MNIISISLVDDRKWASGESEHFVAIAEYSFDTVQDRELPLKPGQRIRLAPSKFQPPDVKGWVLASDGVKIGLVPTNYIKIVGKRSKETGPLNITQHHPPTIFHSDTQELRDNKVPLIINETTSAMDLSNQNDILGMSSDDDSETLVGEPLGD